MISDYCCCLRIFEEIEIYSNQWIKQVEKAKISGKLLCPENQKYEVAKTEKINYSFKQNFLNNIDSHSKFIEI